MPNWKTKIDLEDIHTRYKTGELTPSEVGKETAKIVKRNFYADKLQPVIEYFEQCSDIDEYDNALRQLYDFGDVDHRIWIST